MNANEVIEVAARMLRDHDVDHSTTWLVGKELHADMRLWIDYMGRPIMADLATYTLLGLPVRLDESQTPYALRLVNEEDA